MKWVRFLVVAAVAAFVQSAHAQRAEWRELSRQAMEDIRGDVQSAIKDAVKKGLIPSGKTIAVLPIPGDDAKYGFAAGLLQNALSGAGLKCVLGKDDPLVEEVFAQVEWDERKDGILDPSTVNGFGKLNAEQLLAYGIVRDHADTGDRAFVYIELHVMAIETKRHLWGSTFARRRSDPAKVTGAVRLDPDTKQALQRTVAAAADGLAGAGNLKRGSTVAVIPLAGDMDLYVTQLAQDLLAGSSLVPKRLDITTLAEARRVLKDDTGVAQALLYGAVRDISTTLKKDALLWKEYEMVTEVQLSIQSATDDSILWSKTLLERTMRSEMHPRAYLYGAGVLVVLLLLWMVSRKMSRVR